MLKSATQQSLRKLSTATRTGSSPALQVSTLPNGIRVATESTPGHFAAVGIYANAGSRYEYSKTLGASHLLDRMSYCASKNRTSEQFAQEISALGDQFNNTSSRETMIYQATTYTHTVPQTLDVLSDTVLNPLITEEDLQQQKQAAQWEISEIQKKPELILPELLHEVAYQSNTLGNPLLCPPHQFDNLTADMLREYHQEWYRPERLVFAAAGVPHEDFVDLVKQQLDKFAPKSGILKASSSRPTLPLHRNLSTSSSNKAAVVDLPEAPKDSFEYLSTAPARYTGGQLYIPDAELDFTHLYVAFESFSVHDFDSIYALATLQMLLGGGGSFSAGGPGKGMYSRLYTQVLNQQYQVDHCAAFHHTYNDSGLFGIYISVDHGFANRAPSVIAQQLDALTSASDFSLSLSRNSISQQDLKRAKNQLKSSLMMALESRAMQVEDLARQVQSHGFKTSAEKMCAEVDKVSLSDISRVANAILRPAAGSRLSGEPTVLAKGRVDAMPDVRDQLKRYGFVRPRA